MTVRDNVLVAAYVRPSAGKSSRRSFATADAIERADAAMAAMGLTELANTNIGDLPVLDRKLVMCASALASNPKLLLLDEPVGGLNPQEIDFVIDIVRAHRRAGHHRHPDRARHAVPGAALDARDDHASWREDL